MKNITKEALPVEIKDNELPKDPHYKYKKFNEENTKTNGGFIDAIFLSGAMLVCFLWGMLTIILRG